MRLQVAMDDLWVEVVSIVHSLTDLTNDSDVVSIDVDGRHTLHFQLKRKLLLFIKYQLAEVALLYELHNNTKGFCDDSHESNYSGMA